VPIVLALAAALPAARLAVVGIAAAAAEPPPARAVRPPVVTAPFQLADEARARGVTFVQKNFATERKYPFETLGGAVAALDYDRDGWVDLLLLNGAPSPGHVRTDPATFNRLYRNVGGGRFVDATAGSGLSGEGVKGYPQGVAVGDYDNDGYPDVLVTNYGDNVLYHNDGNGHFSDVTARAGVAMPRHSLKASAAFLDYDNDGWLDLFVTHYFEWTIEKQGDVWCGHREKGHRIYCDPDAFDPLPNALLRNNRDGTFTDVSARVGLDRYAGKGMGIAVADYDGDGRADVFVTNDRSPHFLYRNGADGRLTETAFEAGVAANESGTMVSGMGCDFKDVDDDGRPDVFLTDLVRDVFTLFVNQGDGTFVDRTFPSGLGEATMGHSGWSTKILDLDRDGWKDLFVAGSHVVDNVALYNPSSKYEEGCFFFRNRGDGRFENLSAAVGPDLATPGAWRGVAVADFDGDGSLEVAVSRLNGAAALLAVRGGPARGWLTVDLRGTRSNRDGLGARVRAVLSSGRTLHEHASTANGIYSASDRRVYFGLGSDTVERLEVEWPSGTSQRIDRPAIDRVLRVEEPR
jgi:hypothetical protein